MDKLTIDEVIEHCEKTVKLENNLIIKGRRCGGKVQYTKRYLEHLQVGEWLKELKQYKDLEEKRLFMSLPCKVGTVAYLIDHNFVRMERKPIKCIIDEFTVDRYNDCYAVLNGAEKFYMMRRFRAINIKQFGETIFLTKEEAEKALERLECAE